MSQKCLEWRGERPKRKAINAFLGEVGWKDHGVYRSKRRKTTTIDLTKDSQPSQKRSTSLGEKMREASRIYKLHKGKTTEITWEQAKSQAFGKKNPAGGPPPAAPKKKRRASDLREQGEGMVKHSRRSKSKPGDNPRPAKAPGIGWWTGDKDREPPKKKRKVLVPATPSPPSSPRRVLVPATPSPPSSPRPARRPRDKRRSDDLPDERHKGKEKAARRREEIEIPDSQPPIRREPVRQLPSPTVSQREDDYEFTPQKSSPLLGVGLKKKKQPSPSSGSNNTISRDDPFYPYALALRGYRPSGAPAKTKKEKELVQKTIANFEKNHPAETARIKKQNPTPVLPKEKANRRR